MKPIIFSTDEVRAVQDGRKTQFRRAIEPQPADRVQQGTLIGCRLEDKHGHEIRPPYRASDVVYVRETWALGREFGGPRYEYEADACAEYSKNLTAKAKRDASKVPSWRSPIFMPKAAARLLLRVTGVRAERLQDISESDCIAEGIEGSPYKERYAKAWEFYKANPDTGWSYNPWVWVVEFERVEP